MSKTIAAQLVHILSQAGVKRVHGVVGDSLNSIVDEVRQNGQIEWILYRHEEAAAFAAGAEAQLTGRLAVCAGSCGPGNLHLINGLYDCHRSHAPVLAIAAHIQSDEIGTGYFQETHPERLFQECSHFCEILSNTRQMPHLLQIAIQHALGKSGVSVICLSGDIALETTSESADSPVLFRKPRVIPDEEALRELASRLNHHHKITLLCGIGCQGAHSELIRLGEKILSPMVHTLRGMEHVAYDNPYDVGMSGLIGLTSGYYAMEESELLLMLGTDFPYRDWYPSQAEIVQIDIKPENLGRRCRLAQGLIGDVKETLTRLLPLLENKSDRSFLDTCLDRYKTSREKLDTTTLDQRDGLIYSEYLMAMIDKAAASDAIFCVDVGGPTVWAARYLHMNGQRRLLGSFNHGSMANAMPQAIGAQLEYPDKQVISLSGDGGFSMLMGDILTIRQHRLPVKIVVFNNGSLGFVAMEMKVAGLLPYATDLNNPNFAAMAQSMGLTGIRVEKNEEVLPAIEKALALDGPVLIDVLVNPTELAIPPKIAFSQAKGFGIYMLKQLLNGEGVEVWQTIDSNFIKR